MLEGNLKDELNPGSLSHHLVTLTGPVTSTGFLT